METVKKRSPKNHSARDIAGWKFAHVPLAEKWLRHLGELPEGSRILVKGAAKNGKTDYMVQLAAAFMEAGLKVSYISPEHGKSRSFQAAALRHGIDRWAGRGRFSYCERSQRVFENWFRRLAAPGSGRVVFLDSADYMGLTFGQMKLLFERFPKKTFVVACWLVNPHAKRFEHLMDAVVKVEGFVARPVSRHGGNEDLVIWDRRAGAGGQLSLF